MRDYSGARGAMPWADLDGKVWYLSWQEWRAARNSICNESVIRFRTTQTYIR